MAATAERAAGRAKCWVCGQAANRGAAVYSRKRGYRHRRCRHDVQIANSPVLELESRPDRRRPPRCPLHPATEMQLEAADRPIFDTALAGQIRGRWKRRHGNRRRKVRHLWRCGAPGCPRVQAAAGQDVREGMEDEE